MDCLVFRTRYSGAGIAKMSYVTLYIIKSLLSMRRWSKGRQFRSFNIAVTLEVYLRIVSDYTPCSPSLNCFTFIYIFVVVGVPYS